MGFFWSKMIFFFFYKSRKQYFSLTSFIKSKNCLNIEFINLIFNIYLFKRRIRKEKRTDTKIEMPVPIVSDLGRKVTLKFDLFFSYIRYVSKITHNLVNVGSFNILVTWIY
jgi:predicted patatin/cPLA2 family phospholipase